MIPTPGISPLINSLETYFSVDIETAGPIPSKYALLSIGACRVDDPSRSFYVELRPDASDIDDHALEISGLSITQLTREGTPPDQAMLQFESWVQQTTDKDCLPVFVAFNAPFDWMFINEYFHRYLGRNPFGHTALDIKAFYMAQFKTTWRGTSMIEVRKALGLEGELSHNALQDAIDQALLFQQLLLRWDSNEMEK